MHEDDDGRPQLTDTGSPEHPHAGSAGPAAPEDEAHPWRQHKPRIPAPLEYEHGFLADGKLVPATRDDMLRRAQAGQIFPMGWSPESPWLVWPEELPWVFPAIRARLLAEARRQARPYAIALAAGVVAVVAGLLGWPPVASLMEAAPSWPFFFAILAAWAGAKLFEVRRVARMTPAGFRGEVDDALHGAWLRGRPAPGTKVLRNLFIAVGIAQTAAWGLGHNTPVAAGLVKAAVWQGQWWRLLSAGYLHLGVLHYALNFAALLWLAQLVETHANRAMLAIVFLATILSGNVASLLLMPDYVVSLGASTGLMGLIGFLAVLGWRRRERVPAGLLRTILVNVAIVGSTGLAGILVVDNAGHLGGFVGGLLLGLLLVPAVRPEDGVGWKPSRALRAGGGIAMAALIAGGALTAAILFLSPY